jgi:hypothetical protein
MTRGPYLGPSGVGLSSHWALTELPRDSMKPASKDFMQWGAIQNPCKENGPPRHADYDSEADLHNLAQATVPKNLTRIAKWGKEASR